MICLVFVLYLSCFQAWLQTGVVTYRYFRPLRYFKQPLLSSLKLHWVTAVPCTDSKLHHTRYNKSEFKKKKVGPFWGRIGRSKTAEQELDWKNAQSQHGSPLDGSTLPVFQGCCQSVKVQHTTLWTAHFSTFFFKYSCVKESILTSNSEALSCLALHLSSGTQAKFSLILCNKSQLKYQ